MAIFVILRNGRLQGICRSVGDVEQHLSKWAHARLDEQRFADRVNSSNPYAPIKIVRGVPEITHKTEKVVVSLTMQILDYTEYDLVFPREVWDKGGSYTFSDHAIFMVYTFPDLEVF